MCCVALIGLLLALSFPAKAQQPKKIPRIGFLTTASASDPQTTVRLDAFRQGLRDRGYVEGKTVNIDYRYADGKLERLPQLAEDLYHLNIDILVASNATVARAVKKPSVTIPIVVANIGDLSGLVDSLARPGSNVTGVTHISIELLGKRLELLKEVLPKVSRFVFLDDAMSKGYQGVARETQSAAKALGVQLQVVEMPPGNSDIEGCIPNHDQGAHWCVHHRVHSAHEFSAKKNTNVSPTKSPHCDVFGGRMGNRRRPHVLRGEPK